MTDCPVSASAVLNSVKLYGTDPSRLRGASTKQKSAPVKFENFDCLLPRDQTLSTDIMYINGEAFLVSVASPLGMTFVNYLGKGKAQHCRCSCCVIRANRYYQSKKIRCKGASIRSRRCFSLIVQGAQYSWYTLRTIWYWISCSRGGAQDSRD